MAFLEKQISLKISNPGLCKMLIIGQEKLVQVFDLEANVARTFSMFIIYKCYYYDDKT